MSECIEWPLTYAVRHKEDTVRAASRSGGIFTALSDSVLMDNGTVYGCVLTEDFRAVHIRADDAKTRDLMHGSKYIQSQVGDAYKNVKADLISGKKVLFSGTSCQIAGLRSFLGKEYDGLTCVDIVCHGVPSQRVWLQYINWQEKKVRKKVVAVDFRNKKDFGWKAHIETLTMDDGTKVNSEVFKNLFYGHAILRPCCYECPYKSILHPGDITIADYWGIEKAAPEFADDKGVSLVLINNHKGMIAFEACSRDLVWKSTDIVLSMQQPLIAPFPRPENRDAFWHDFRTSNFEKIAKRYGGYGAARSIRNVLGKTRRDILSKLSGRNFECNKE